MIKLAILGGSNAFWEISELISDINAVKPTYEITHVFDDSPALIGKQYDSLTVEGPLEKALLLPDEVQFVFAIGSFRTHLIRAQILERLNLPETRFESLIHPTAKIFSTSTVKNGCIIHYGTVIFNHTTIEPFVVIAANCVIAVGNLIGKGALFGSNITTTTGVKIGPFSFIGSSSSIAEGVEIEPGARVGMGSLLLKDIKAGAFVMGNPPRFLDKTAVPTAILESWEILKSINK